MIMVGSIIIHSLMLQMSMRENLLYLNTQMDKEALIHTLKKKNDVIKVLSLNCQSILAKFDQLSIYTSL